MNSFVEQSDATKAYEMFITGEAISFEKMMRKLKLKNAFNEEEIKVANQGFEEFCDKALELFHKIGNFSAKDLKSAIPNNFWILMVYK